MVPVPLGEEQLQRPHGAARRHRNGLHALAPQVRQQSPTVNAKVTHHPAFAQTSPERANELRQRRTQPGDLLWRHRRPPCRWEVYREPPPQNLSFSCAVLLDRYLSATGLLGLVITQTLFQTTAGNEFRRFSLPGEKPFN